MLADVLSVSPLSEQRDKRQDRQPSLRTLLAFFINNLYPSVYEMTDRQTELEEDRQKQTDRRRKTGSKTNRQDRQPSLILFIPRGT